MKSHSFQIKPFTSILSIMILCSPLLQAQNNPVITYLQQAGDCADIYNGRMETPYNTLLFKTFPYYMKPDYTEATVVYRNNPYPHQRVRLDLFKEQLILLPPEKQFGVIVSFQNVEKIYMYNRTFVRLVPTKGSGIKPGFYIQLLEKDKLHLYSKVTFNFEQKIDNKQLSYGFEYRIRYYLLYNDRYHSMSNKGSFSKLFPQYKKQINKYAKDNKLNFKQNADESFTSLAGYCEELITSTSNL